MFYLFIYFFFISKYDILDIRKYVGIIDRRQCANITFVILLGSKLEKVKEMLQPVCRKHLISLGV